MNLKRFFSPRSVAVVGVSENPKKVGHLVGKNMLAQKYSGDLYFIHPSGHKILGVQSLKSLKEIGKEVDLVVLAIPATLAVPYLDEVAAIGCHNVVLFAAGFGETHTSDGDTLEQALHKKLEEHAITLLGPNCIGYINTDVGVNATFFNHVAPHGNIGIISQSGALGTAVLDYVAAKTHVGLSHFISLGNKSSLDESDCLEYLKDDPKTTVIGMYLEDVKDGDRFRKVLRETTQKKPVVVLKSGRTEAGSQAAMSHTGSMVGNDDVFDAALSQAGALRADSFAEFEMILKLYSLGAIPSNDNVLVLSNAGGMGVLLADEIISQGLHLVTVSEDTTVKLAKAFEDTKKISVHNPIDLLGDASSYDYRKAIRLTMEEKDIGSVIVLLTPQANTEVLETAKELRDVYHEFKYKPLYPIFMGKDSVSEAHKYLEKEGIASFRYFSPLPAALKKILQARVQTNTPSTEVASPEYRIALRTNELKAETVLREKPTKAKFLNQYDSLRLLEYAGIRTAQTFHAIRHEDLDTVVEKVGYPLVAKIASDKITHKTEVKGVITGITVREELVNAFQSLNSIGGPSSGCYLQKQYLGHELIVGATRDITFGVVVMVGIGGIYAELLKEVVQLAYPFTREQFALALEKSKMQQLTREFRNMRPLNVARIHDVALRLGLLLQRFPQIDEIDINPLIASGDEVIAVDGRVICAEKN